jgi:tetratricopeptide (TPR) repeat protein
LRLASLIRGSVAALVLFAPALAADAPSLTAIATALRVGHAQEAETMATEMLAANDPVPLTNAYLLLDRGLAREQLGKRREAVKDFSAAIDSKALPRGDLARALFDRGVTLDELGRTDDAIADYSHAIELVPRYATALNNRANAYRRTGRYALARIDYQAALAAGDDEPEYPLYGLGRIAEAQSDPAMAKAFYQRALAANSLFTPAAQRIALLGPLPANGGYNLRAPGMPPVPKVATAPPSEEIKLQKPAPRAADPAADDLVLRPAILDAGKKKPFREAPAHVASFVPPEPSAGAAGNGGEWVQLGAWRNQGDAALGWDKAAASAGDLLSGATPRIVEADIPGKGHFWRLRTHAPAGTSAADFCAQLHAKGLGCIAAKS